MSNRTFLPSINGFHFSNSNWPDVPVMEIPGPFGKIPLGNAGNGLCGGMATLICDYFVAGKLPPESSDNPAVGSDLYNDIVARFMDSLSIPWGIIKAYSLTFETDPLMSIVDPILKDILQFGVCPITLILVQSYNPIMSDHNHQVTAYGIEGVKLRIYDNNYPDDDSRWIDVVTMKDSDGYPVRAFYRNKWLPKAVG